MVISGRKRAQEEIDFTADIIEDQEELMRFLCSPQYYNEELDMVNLDAFDLRMLGKNSDVPETYASLGRCRYLDSPRKMQKYIQFAQTRIKWPEHSPKNTYSGYARFNCMDAKEVHDMIEIHPLKDSHSHHVGLFYKKSNDEYYEGPLPKTEPDILEMLMDLTSIVEVTRVPE